MNRIAVITDIHGNVPALQASLAAIDAIGVDEIYCGGDLVGYGPHPNGVCALIRELTIPTIYGNYDYAIARDFDDCGCAYVTQHDRELGQQSVEWTLEHTDEACQGLHARAAVRSAFPARRPGRPPRARLAAQGQRVPVRGQTGQPVRAAREAEEAQVLVFGHTHKPWIREYGGVLFVNCGSVGKPKDGDPRAAFAILEADETGRCARRSSASRTTPRPSHARSQQPGCQASTPKSSSGQPRCPTAPTNSPRLR